MPLTSESLGFAAKPRSLIVVLCRSSTSQKSWTSVTGVWGLAPDQKKFSNGAYYGTTRNAHFQQNI